MNKEEIEHKLEQAKADKFEINKQVQILEAQLIEAEKPKLRHGDFGYEDGNFPTVIMQETQFGDPLKLRSIRESHSCSSSNRTHYNHTYAIFGNIFDLLKEWSEDLTEFIYAGVHFKMKGRVLEITIHGEMITITGIESQMECWSKFGRLIATLKRRSPQE